jgi:hypothetical protein
LGGGHYCVLVVDHAFIAVGVAKQVAAVTARNYVWGWLRSSPSPSTSAVNCRLTLTRYGVRYCSKNRTLGLRESRVCIDDTPGSKRAVGIDLDPNHLELFRLTDSLHRRGRSVVYGRTVCDLTAEG